MFGGVKGNKATNVGGYITHRVIGVIAVFSILIVLTFWIGFSQVEKRLVTQTTEELQSRLKSSHEVIHHIWIDGLLDDLAIWAKDPLLISHVLELLDALRNHRTMIDHVAQKDIRRLLADLVAHHDAKGIFVIAPDFISLASMRDDNIGSKNLISIHYPERLKEVFKGTSQYIPAIPSDVPLLNNDEVLQGYPTSFVVVPMFDDKGSVLAALALRLNPQDKFSLIHNMWKFGDTGEAYAFNDEGYIISKGRNEAQLRDLGLIGPNETSILKVKLFDPGFNMGTGESSRLLNTSAEPPLNFMAQRALAGETGFSSVPYRNYRGVPVYGAWLWDKKLGIGFAVEIDAQEVIGSYKLETILAYGMALIMLLLFSYLFLEWRLRQGSIELLRSSEEFQRIILDNTATAIITVDENKIIHTFNKTAQHLFGYKEEEAVGENYIFLLPRHFREGHVKHFDSFAVDSLHNVSTDGVSREVYGCHKSGIEIPLHIDISQNVIADEKIFTLVVQNLSERKMREDELTKLYRAIDQCPASVIITDIDGKLNTSTPFIR